MKPFALLVLLGVMTCFALPAAADEVDDLVAKLKAKDIETRVDACAAVGKLGAKAKGAVSTLENLVSKDPNKLVKRAAINALGDIGSTASPGIAALLVVFKADADLRPDAGKALGRIGGPNAVPGLKALLPADKKNNDIPLRTAAATTLGDIGPDAKTAVKALHALLSEKDAGLKQAAIVTLGKIGPDSREAIPDLLEILSEKDKVLKVAAIEAVSRIGAESKISVKTMAALADNPDGETATLAVEGLARMGKNGAAALAEKLKNPERRLLILRAMAASKSDCRGAVAELLPLTSDESPEVRKLSRTILDALGKGAATDLIKVLKAPAQPEATRLAAVATLAKLEPGKENLADLARLLKDPKPEVRGAGADALARLGPDAVDALAELVAAMRDEDGTVRMGVGRAIKNTGAKGAARLRSLEEKEKDPAVKANLAVAVRLTDFAAKENAVPALITALADKEDIVARMAADTLGKLGEPAVNPLVEALKAPTPSVRRYAALALKELGVKAKKAVPLLTEALHDKDPSTRPFAAQALAAVGPDAKAAASELINGMLQDPDKEMRLNCAQALIAVDADARLAAPAFRKALRDKSTAVVDCAVEGLTKLGSAAVTELSEALKDKDESVRLAAVDILSSLGLAARPAVSVLQEATRDTNGRIAATAKKLLETIANARLLQLLNEFRTKGGRTALTADPILMRVTLEHAKLMAKEKKTDPMPPKSPAEKARDAGYKFETIGLLQLPARDLNADTMFDALVNSKIIDQLAKAEFNEIGIGIDGDDANNYYIAILYAKGVK
jgi:HEAT repeat protein